MASSLRALALCAVVPLAACGGGGGSAPAGASSQALVVSWVIRSVASAGSGTQADAIHLGGPPQAAVVTASRGGAAQTFNLAVDPSCTAVYVATNSAPTVTVGVVSDPNAPTPVTIVPGGPGPWDVTWNVVSVGKGTCNVVVTTSDGMKATLQVFSEL